METKIWCAPECQDTFTAAQALCILRPKQDVAVLPASADAKEFFDFGKELLHLDVNQVIWVNPEEESEGNAALESRIQSLLAEKKVPQLVPYTLDRDAETISHDGCKVVGENAEWISKYGHKGILHRHIKHLDDPCIIETVDPDIKVPKGYTCSTVAQLQIAYHLLECTDAVLKPLYGHSGEGILFLSSPEELRLYDFPLGDVVLEERLAIDCAPDGMPISATVSYGQDGVIFEHPSVCDQLLIGKTNFGCRSSVTSPEFQAQIVAQTKRIIEQIKPTGMGGFDFLSVGGNPVLLDVNTGRITTEHFARLFHEQHAKGSTFVAWHYTPSRNLDVWTFWCRIVEHKIAFHPQQREAGKPARGVFPLCYLKDQSSIFIAFGSDEEEALMLKQAAEESLREPIQESRLELVSYTENVRRIWCTGPRPEYRRETQRYNLATRSTSLVRPGKDFIILPGGHEGVAEYWRFCRDTLGLNDDQVLFTSGTHFNLDDDVDDELVSRMKALVTSSGEKFALFPYGVTSNFLRWANQFRELGVSVFGEEYEWVQEYGHKGILHRHMSNLEKPSLMEEIDPKITVAVGYTCATVQHLLDAYRLMLPQMKTNKVVIKPVFGAAGEGILFVSSEEELSLYDFPFGEVCLEEMLVLDHAPDGMVISPAIHYMESSFIGDLVDQIMVGQAYAGWRVTQVPKTFITHAMETCKKIIAKIKPQGPGGFDFLCQNGIPYLSDINTGRFNGSHTPKLFVEMHAPGKKWYCWKKSPSSDFDVWTCWQKFQEKGIAYVPGTSQKGVFPLIYIRGMTGQFIAVADTNEEAAALAHTADTCIMSKEKVPEALQKYSAFKKADILGRNIVRIWCQSQSTTLVSKNIHALVSCPMRAMSILRSNDIVVVPANENVTEFFDFCKELLHLRDDQLLLTSGKSRSLNHEITDEVLESLAHTIAARVEHAKNAGKKTPVFTLVPTTVSQSFQDWAHKLTPPDTEIAIFGNDLQWSQKYSTAALLYRSIKTPDEPSLVESLGTNVQIPKGFVCESLEELTAAFKLLGGTCVLRAANPELGFLLVVTRESELKAFNWRQGPAVLLEYLVPDKAPDGISIVSTISYLRDESFGKGVMDRLLLGSEQYGLRPSVTSLEYQNRMWAAASKVLKRISPQGAGSFEFICVNDTPVLHAVAAGYFSDDHFPKLFHELYAKETVMLVWKHTPPANLDIWTFWNRVCDRDMAFYPKTADSHYGVFPLIYMKAAKGVFMAFGEDVAHARKIQEAVDAALREEVVERLPERMSFKDSSRRIWCCLPTENNRNEEFRLSFASRMLPLVRPDKDVIVVPANNEPVAEFVEHMSTVLGLKSEQILYSTAADYDTMDDECTSKLKAIVVSSEDSFVLVPYATTPAFLKWSSQLFEIGVGLFGESEGWASMYCTRAILHRHIRTPETPSVIETLDPAVRVAPGFVCSTIEDLQKAYTELGVQDVIIKPCLGLEGDGVLFLSEASALNFYDFPYGDVLLESDLAVDKASDGIVLAPVVHYMEGATVGKLPMDQIIVGKSNNGFRTSHASKSFTRQVNRWSDSLLKKISPQGPGSLDYLSYEGKPLLNGVNFGHFDPGLILKLFQEAYAPSTHVYMWRFKPAQSLTITEFWGRLRSAAVAFQPGVSKEGVYPLLFLRGVAGVFVSIADSELNCALYFEKANRCLRLPLPQEVEPPSHPLPSKFHLTLIKNAEEIYDPQRTFSHHMLIGGESVVGILDDATATAMETISSDITENVIDATGCIIVPGIVDMHVHVTGGGGEAGPTSRTPEAVLSELILGGLTTVIGVLGTDRVSRSLENVLTKVRAINEEGLTAYMWTGSYHVPPVTLCGNVTRDMCLIEQVLGVGEVAISDHRGSQPTFREICTLVSEARVGGMLSGKAGLVYCHMGPGSTLLQPLREVVEKTDLPITTFLPTHMDRSEELIKDGAQWIRDGGYVDFTARSVKTLKALAYYVEQGLPLDHIMVSSDAYGSLPSFDANGNLVRYRAADTKAQLRLLQKLYFQETWRLENALPLMTSTPASVLKLTKKGRLTVGSDADILILDKQTLALKWVIARGQVVKTPDMVKKGCFEEA